MTILFAIASAFRAAHEQAMRQIWDRDTVKFLGLKCEVPSLKHEKPFFATDLTLLLVSMHLQINLQSQQ